ncbi:MAG: phage holin family protein [Verrucomicrobia bacterium]|nr:phage holin family protein [Verrucomicrobiota bacterium]
MAEIAETAAGLLAAAKALLKTLLATGRNRLELLLVEAQEERGRLFEALLLALAVAVLSLMTLLVVTFTVVAVFWETHRVGVLAGFGVVYAAAAGVLFWKLRRRLRNWTAFAASLAELDKDKTCWKP